MVKDSSKTKSTKSKNLVKLRKDELAKKMKIEMIRYCMVWCYNDKQTVAYFKERGVELSIGYYYELRRDYLSDQATKGWYTEQAIGAMEVTHKQSIEQLDELIKSTMLEIQQLQSTPVYLNSAGEGKTPKLELNENHDAAALSKSIDTFTSLIKLRDDMLAATPVVQAIMNKHALDKAITKELVTK